MLAATGIFGMAAYSVSKQLREQGIRMPVPGELNRGKLSMQCNMTLLHSGRFARTGSRFLSSWMSLISKAFAPDGIFGMEWLIAPRRAVDASIRHFQQSAILPRCGLYAWRLSPPVCKYPRSHESWSVAAVPALLSDPLPRPEAMWSTCVGRYAIRCAW